METKKKQFKKFNGKKEEPQVTWSTLTGVQRLELNKFHIFPVIKNQLIETEKLDLLTIRREFPGLYDDEAGTFICQSCGEGLFKTIEVQR